MKLKILFFLISSIAINNLHSQLASQQALNNVQINNTISTESPEKWARESFGDWNQNQEETSLRDRNAKHFKNDDGSYTAIIAAGNLHYWENNQWKTIFHSIEQSSNDFRNLTNSHKTFYPLTASNSLRTILPGGNQFRDMIEMRMYFEVNGQENSSQNIIGTTGMVDFNVLTYPNVYGPGIDLRLTQETTKRKMDYIIANINALGSIPNLASFLVFEEKVELPVGWVAELIDNNIYIKDAAGTVMAIYENPVFKDTPQLDSDGHYHNDEAEGTYTLIQNGNILTIQTKVQLTWLLDTERTFPVVIDPTVNLYPNNSAWWTGQIDAYHSNSSTAADAPLYSASTFVDDFDDYIVVGRYNFNYSMHGWAKFNTSGLPNSCVNAVNLNYRVSYNYSGDASCGLMCRLRHLSNDPTVTTGNTLLNDIRDGSIYEVKDFRCYTTGSGWVNTPMTANLNELENSIPQGWFGVGFYNFQGGPHEDCYTEIYGYSSANRPYLVVNYTPYYQVQFSSPTPTTFCAGQTQNVSVTVTNTGCLPWTSGWTIPNTVNFSWWGSWQAGGLAGGQDNNPRLTPFVALAPGASQTITFSVTAPSTPGSYSIQTDLVRDGVCWFRNNSAPSCGPGNSDFIIPITVNSLPTVNAGADAFVCNPGSTNLNGSSSSSGPWSGSATPNANIPDNNSTGISSVINIPSTCAIASNVSSVSLNITHSFVADLDISLIAPNGSIIDLSSDNGSSGDNYTNIVFGTSGTAITAGVAPFTGTFTPEQPFSSLTGPAQGNWTLRVVDDAGSDVGTLLNWSITITNSSCGTYLWSPSTGLSSTTILNPVATPASTTTYTLTATSNGCSNTDQVTVTVQSPAGNPAVFGNNVWNVYGYNGDNINLAANTYRGYYIQPDLGGGNHGVNTQAFWSNGNSPSDAGVAINTGNIWNGCNVNPDYHTVVQKRKGFPCGTYNLSMNNWDDETRVYLNGALIWSCTAWSGAGTCPTGNIGMHMLDGDSELEIRSFEQVGGSNVEMSVIAVTPTQLSVNGSTRTCRVSGGNSFIFFLDANGRLIAAINPQNQDLGYVTMTSYVDPTNALVPACAYPTYPEYMTSMMQRHWVINKTNPAATPVQVGLPFLNSELGSLVTVSNANANIYDNVSVIGEVLLSKYQGPNNVNSSALDNCAVSGGNENMTLHGQTGNGNLAGIFPGFVNTSYATYSVPNFSEFWLHGASNNSPLPITLSSFAAVCNETGDEVNVQWTTASESNTSHFDIERSLDGSNWDLLGTTNAAGNSTTTQHYEMKDLDARGHSVIYYRLKQYDNDGAMNTYGPVSAECLVDQNSFELFPNPAETDVTILLNGTQFYGS